MNSSTGNRIIMRIVATFVSVLIAGILSFTVAQEQIPSQQISIGAPQMQRFVQYSEKHITRKCERNGGLAAYEESNYKDHEQKFVNCVQSLVNITQFEAELAAVRPHGGQNILIQNYCRRVPSFKNCLKNVTEPIKPCLDLEERESVNILYKMTTTLLQFACDNGDVVENFIAAGGTKCLASKYPAVQECSRRIFQLPKPDAVTIPGLAILPNLSLNTSGCMNLEEYRRCSVKVLEKCGNSTPSAVINDLFNLVRRETSCEISLNQPVLNRRVKRSWSCTVCCSARWQRIMTGAGCDMCCTFGSHASLARVADVLVITVAMMTSSLFA